MHEFIMDFQEGHLFVDMEGDDWLLDTGAPTRFGKEKLSIEGQDLSIPNNYLGLTAEHVSEFMDHPTVGIIGADILNKFDIFIDRYEEQESIFFNRPDRL